MWIKRVKISGWKSYSHDEPVDLEDCGPVNLLFGANNAGKSNLQRFFHHLALAAHNSQLNDHRYLWTVPQRFKLHLAERHVGWTANPKEVRAEIEYSKCGTENSSLFPDLIVDGRCTLVIRARVGSFGYGDIINFVYPTTGVHLLKQPGGDFREDHLLMDCEGQAHPHLGELGSSGVPLAYREFLDDLLLSALVASIRIVGPHRNINSPAADPSPIRLDAGSIANELYRLKNNEERNVEWSNVQEDVQQWLARLLGCDRPQIDFITPQKDSLKATLQLQVHQNRRQPPAFQLGALGAGVTDLFTILAFLRLRVSREPMVLFIDEIEAHLHPSAVREFVYIIRENFKNIQLFLSTHSTDLIDSMEIDWRLYRFSMNDGVHTRVTKVMTNKDRLATLVELGYRPSQLFLANSVLCVEGPSDMIYVKSLIHHIDPDLIEGRDFAFLPYGGSNLKYVSYEDDGASLVKLLELTHHPIVICDRDRENDSAPLKPAVQRMRDAAHFLNLTVHPTEGGYEIESILSSQALCEVVAEILKGKHEKYQGTLDCTKLDLTKPLRKALADAITPSSANASNAEVIANEIARRHKVEIAQMIGRNVHSGTFSAVGRKFGKDICDEIRKFSGRRRAT